MLKNSQLQMISMLQGMEEDASLQQGSITIITKRFDVACSTVYQLWEWAAHTHDTGIIISLELNSQKKFHDTTYLSDRVCLRGCQEHAAKEETYTAKTCIINQSVKNHCVLLDCCFNHSCLL